MTDEDTKPYDPDAPGVRRPRRGNPMPWRQRDDHKPPLPEEEQEAAWRAREAEKKARGEP